MTLNVGFIFNLFLLDTYVHRDEDEDEELSSHEVRRKEYVDLDNNNNNKKKTKEKITVDPVLGASSI